MGKTEYIMIEEESVIYVNRTMPTILDDFMSLKEWKEFCNKIDDALQPVNDFKLFKSYFLPVFFGNVVILVVVFSVTQTLMVGYFAGNEFGAGDTLLAMHMIVTVAATFAYVIYCCVWHSTVGRTMKLEIKRIVALAERKPKLMLSVQKNPVEGLIRRTLGMSIIVRVSSLDIEHGKQNSN